MNELPPLIAALCDPRRFDPPVDRVEVIETHISWVLLAGEFAYKIKKPVDLGFLDFSTLERRRHFCEEEVRLNRRLAPELYLGTVTITGSPHDPTLDGAGPAIEYAVKMRRFDHNQALDRLAARHQLAEAHIDDLVTTLAEFHARADVATGDDPYGTPESVCEPAMANFSQISRRLEERTPALARLQDWSETTCLELRDTFAQRKAHGYVRECHGDVHLANAVLYNGRIRLFDCLEFNSSLRWIDVMSEIAFLVMDLDDRNQPPLARRALNRYLELTGDYAGLGVLRFYLTYRAMVRAKVAAIRGRQPGLDAAAQRTAHAEFQGYEHIAERYTTPPPVWLAITHGPSGSGKTWVARQLVENTEAILVRSDIERKRLHGLAPLARSDSAPGTGIYTEEANTRTYQRLAELAETVLSGGYPAIVDGAFLKASQRDVLRQVARSLGVPFHILDITAPESVLRTRVRARNISAVDASEADVDVLERQLAAREPFNANEVAEKIEFQNQESPGNAGRLKALSCQLGATTNSAGPVSR